MDEKCADLHKPFISLFCSWLASRCSQRRPFQQQFPWALQIREQILKEHLFQDAVLSMSFWLRLFPVRGWRTRSLSSVSGLPTCWRCVRGWLMRLLWAYEHDLAAILPFLSQRIGTLCRHPRWSLWLEQRTTGCHSGRSEGDSKSLSAGYIPTDLFFLTQRTCRPVPGWFRWSVPRGAQHLIRCAIRR